VFPGKQARFHENKPESHSNFFFADTVSNKLSAEVRPLSQTQPVSPGRKYLPSYFQN